MKKKHIIFLIAALAAAAAVPVIWLVITSVSVRPEPTMEKVTYKGVEYTYADFLTGCVLEQLKSLDSPPSDNTLEGIKATAMALDCSARYLYKTGKALDGGYPCMDFINDKEGLLYFGEELYLYKKYAAEAAAYAIKAGYNIGGELAFLPVCRISSGTLISPEDSGYSHVRKLRCSKDEKAAFYKGGCQLTADGIAEIMITRYPSLVIPPDESKWISEIVRDDTGSVLRLNVCGINMSAEEFRRIFSVRSPAFEISYTQRLYSFETKGDGCNMGMSVYSAVRLSMRGYKAEEILREFYV